MSDDWSNNRDLSVLVLTGTINDNIYAGGFDQLSSMSSLNDGVNTNDAHSIIIGGSFDDIITSIGQCAIQCGDQCSIQPSSSIQSFASVNGSEWSGHDQMTFFGNKQVIYMTSLYISISL
jgi:hypothetical protein